MARGSSALLALLFAAAACAAPADPEGGYVNPGNLGGGGDDDDGGGEPAIELDPAEVGAGEFLDVLVTLTDFDLGGADVAYGPSSEDVVFHGIQDLPDGDVFPMRFHFGLLAYDGVHPWGLLNADHLLMTEFGVSAIDPPPPLLPGFPAESVDLGAGEQFAAWSLSAPADRFVVLRARPEATSLQALVWLMDADGVTVLDEQAGDELMVWYTEEPFEGYVRVQDASMADGLDFDVDLALVEPGAPIPIEEVEPNDEPEAWQDLGSLDVGRYQLSGMTTISGHDEETNNPNGDLDVFTFEVVEPSRVAFELAWVGTGDLDAVLYVHGDGETELGFDSPQAVDLSMATLANPENADLQLEAGVRYTLMVASWQGDPGLTWTLDLSVYPGLFPED